MKVFFSTNIGWSKPQSVLDQNPDLLLLTANDWDDFGFKTTLTASLYFGGVEFELDFMIKILIDDVDYTSGKLNQLRAEGWDGYFPIPDENYISLPSDIDFYSVISSKLGIDKAKIVLLALRDAGFMVHTLEDDRATKLVSLDGFYSSLQRESGAIKAYDDGHLILEISSETEIMNFDLNIVSKSGSVRKIPFRFTSKLLPYDINVLIGPNGIGKSYCLQALVEYWLQIGMGDPEELRITNHKPFDSYPSLGKLILVSYSPFEEFTLDLQDENLQDKHAYKYFGFRCKDKDGGVTIDRDLPEINSAESLLKAVYDDKKFDFVNDRIKKLVTILTVLNTAFEYDAIVLEVADSSAIGDYIFHVIEIEDRQYIPVSISLAQFGTIQQYLDCCDLSKGVIFIKDEKIVNLSSGQRFFTYMVINVVGELRENSLVVIDEPELFLHPTLEIEFISLLKSILKPFKSRAILATHSLAVVREVPSKCVHIFRDEGEGLDIVEPPFQTFGGDMQRISSYVFGDKSVTKPFDEWLNGLVKDIPASELIERLSGELNEELTMKLLRLGGRKVDH